MNNLVFYDKEGNYLNFNWNEDIERYEGDLLFHENSNDTYKTQAIYTFEKLPGFEFEDINSLSLRKWQLFNEKGFHFWPSSHLQEEITLIEPINNKSDFYSKWIYGLDFEEKFKKGTLIRFDFPIFEFINPNKVYPVISSKKGAILIISDVDNSTFTSTYTFSTFNYSNKTISSLDALGIYDYVNSSTLISNLSSWNESDFYNRFYNGRKLSIINSQKNDNYSTSPNSVPKKYQEAEVVTVKKSNLIDLRHYEFIGSNLPVNNQLNIEVKLKTDLPIIFNGLVSFFDSTTTLTIGLNNFTDVVQFGPIPKILKPGVKFLVQSSNLNSGFLVVSNITQFRGISNLVQYVEGSQVLFNDNIYQCIKTHDWVLNVVDIDLTLAIPKTNSDPTDVTFWTPNRTYLPVTSNLSFEAINSDIYLSSNNLSFTQSFTQSSAITLASAFNRFRDSLESLDITLNFEASTGNILAEPNYPSDWVNIRFLAQNSSGILTDITTQKNTWERIVEVDEQLTREFNYDFSENFVWNIVFTDLDEFGFIFDINGESYGGEVNFVYSSGQIDLERTIDSSLRGWYLKWSGLLLSLGIITKLKTTGSISLYFNTISLETEYPNIPLEFGVQVGTTGDFYLPNKRIQFYEPSLLATTIPGYAGASFSLGNFIDISVNNRSYGITHSLPNPFSTIDITLENWIEEWSSVLDNFGIFVDKKASALEFRTKSQNLRCDVSVRVASSVLPGDKNYDIIDLTPGNHGTLLTSNEIILGTYSNANGLEDVGFSTGMVVGINGTSYPLQNIEYNVILLDPNKINLSYEGPFWGSTGSICNLAPFASIAFSSGFTGSICSTGLTGVGGQFNTFQFNNSYFISSQNPTTYSVNSIVGVDNMVDLVWVPDTTSIFVLGSSSTTGDVRIFDSISGNFVKDLDLQPTSQPLKILYNSVDSYVYSLASSHLWKIDPYSNNIITSFTLSQTAFSLDFNRQNGDIYVTGDTSIEIFINSGVTKTTINTTAYSGCWDLVFNDFQNDMYVSTRDGSTILRIDGTTRTIQNTYTIPGLTQSELLYEPVEETIFTVGTFLSKLDNGVVSTYSISIGSVNSLSFNPLLNSVYTSNDNALASLDVVNNSFNFNTPLTGYWGETTYNSYDNDIYISSYNISNPGLFTIDGTTGLLKNVVFVATASPTTKIISNPDRNSVWALQPSLMRIIEVLPSVTFNLSSVGTTFSNIFQNVYGSLSPEFQSRDYLWLHTKDFIRRPRRNFNTEKKTTLYWKWISDNVPEFFLYDFSGQLLPNNGLLSYRGPKPLQTIHLNRNSNRDLNKVYLPQYQQTIFPIVYEELSYVDDPDDTSIIPEPLETYIGFNSQLEGGLRSVLQLFMKEPIDFTINTESDTTDVITFRTVINSLTGIRTGEIEFDLMSNSNFWSDSNGNSRGLSPGQHLAIFVSDVTNTKNQYISLNNGYLVRIKELGFRKIIVDFFKEIDSFTEEKTILQNFPNTGKTSYLSVRFRVWDKEIGRFNVFGQTEIEDIRYKYELGNVGKLVSSDDVYIFKEYDINEEGIDWTFLNKKRKEMLIMKSLIYPYIGSYKSIINAINYFGYNDLELYEYYRNINPNSSNYFKLFKVEIPDIFNQSVSGWTENDFIKNTFPNANYEETNLFNLTYLITDKEGNNVLNYTLREVQIKLQGLKYWLQKNIIPITHKILDITGRADFVSQNTISHIVRDVKIFKTHEDFTPVSFKLNELYLMPVNNGSTVYNCVLDFYLKTDNNQFYSGVSSSLPDYYTIDIKTYQIYREWYPFTNYEVGDRIFYFDKLYESVIPNNKTNNPRKFDDITSWQSGTIYSLGDLVEWQRNYWVYSGYGLTGSGLTGLAPTASFISPTLDSGFSTASWLDVTEWKEIDLKPVQKISEFRRRDNLYPFNFTIDSNIDPFLVIEVSSENGYGSTYRDKKNYEIRGILDIRELESFSNLTSKQYTESVISTIRP